MNQLKQTLSLGLVVLTLGLLTVGPLGASDPKPAKGNWDDLKKLAPGDDIRIVLNDAKSYGAKFQSVSDEAIVVRLVTGEQTFSRESILRVSARSTPHRGRNAMIGAAAGFAACLGIGAATAASRRKEYPYNKYTEAGAVIGVVACAPAGAGIAALMPTGGWHDVYRAR
jgi:hypothetical protein